MVQDFASAVKSSLPPRTGVHKPLPVSAGGASQRPVCGAPRMSPEDLLFLARVVVIVTFGLSAWSKLRDLDGFHHTITAFKLASDRPARVLAPAVLGTELLVVALVAAHRPRRCSVRRTCARRARSRDLGGHPGCERGVGRCLSSPAGNQDGAV